MKYMLVLVLYNGKRSCEASGHWDSKLIFIFIVQGDQ